MSARDDWFRSGEWDSVAQVEFEAGLGRAQSWNRPQYIKIKGLALLEAGHVDAARGLFLRVLDLDDDGMSRPAALEHLAATYAEDQPVLAEALYRQRLDEHPTMNGTTGTAEVALAELLLTQGGRDRAEEASALLETWIETRGSPLPSVRVRWWLAVVDAALALGDTESARDAAQAALSLAEQTPVFPRHPDVGGVTLDAVTRQRLEQVAAGNRRAVRSWWSRRRS